MRFALVFIILTAYDYFRKKRSSIPRNRLYAVVVLSVLYSLVVVCFTTALQHATLANVLFTFYGANLITSFLCGTLVLGETLSWQKVIAMVVALAGLTVYASALLEGDIGIVLSVLAGISGGVSNMVSKQLAGVNRNAVVRAQYAISTIFVVIVTLLSGEQMVRQVSWKGSILTVVFALVLIAGSKLILYGYQNFDVNIGSVISATELVFGALLGYLIFHEVPAVHELVGGLLIFTASVLGSGVLDKLKSQPIKTAQPD